MGNPYEDVIDEQDAPQAAAPTAQAPPNPYLDLMNEESGLEETRLRGAFQQSTLKPDEAAEASTIAIRLGVPQQIVERNLPDYKKRYAIEGIPYQQIEQQSPKLAAALKAKPEIAAVVKDDLENLGAWEWLTTAPQRAMARGINQVRYAQLRHQSIFRELTREEKDQLFVYKQAMHEGGELGTAGNWFKGAITGAFEQLPNTFGASLMAGKRAIQAGGTAAGVGMLTGPIMGVAVPAMVTGAATAGARVGAAEFSFQMESALALDEFMETPDEFGRHMDPKVAKVAAIAVGTVNAGLEVVGLELLARTVPGLKNFSGAAVRGAVKQALRVPTIRAALANVAKDYGEALGGNVVEEVAQRAITILGGEVIKYLGTTQLAEGQTEPGNIDLYKQPTVPNADGSVSTVHSFSIEEDGREVLLPTVTAKGEHLEEEAAIAEYRRTGKHLGKFTTPAAATTFATKLHDEYEQGLYQQTAGYRRTVGETLGDLWRETTGSFQGLALMPLPGAVMTVAQDVRRANQAADNVAYFKALAQGAKDSKTIQRMPQVAQDLIAEATKGGPLEHLYAPTGTFSEYWQSKNVDPEEMAAELTGDSEAWQTAVRTGEDLRIPTARYATKIAGTEHHAYFAEELRVDPDGMNQREAKAFAEQQKATRSEPKAPSASELEREQVRTQTEERLTAAAVPSAVAGQYANLVEAFAGTIGESEGVRPTDVVGPNLRIARPDVDVLRPAGGQASPTTRATSPTTAAAAAAPGGQHATAAAARLLGTEATPASDVAEAAAPSQETPGAAQAAAAAGPSASASFLAFGPGGPLYQVAGGPSDRSTLSADDLVKLGIAVPETPPDTGERLSGEQVRDRMAAAAGPRAEAAIARAVDAQPTPTAEAVARRPQFDPDERIDLTDMVAAAKRMRAEDPLIDAKAKALAERSRSSRTPAPPRVRASGSDILVETDADQPATREGLSDRAREQREADQSGLDQGAREGRGAEPGRLQTPGIPELDEVFERQPAEANARRLTPEVRRELERIAEELGTFQFTPHTIVELGPTEKKTGNYGGGNANIIPGSGGASVYHDVLGFSPVNLFRGKPAKLARGDRGDVARAVGLVLSTNDIPNNLAEGAVRVAEHRNAGIWTDLSFDITTLPPHWGTEISAGFDNALDEAIDLATAPEADLLADSTAVDQEPGEDVGTTSFDVSEFDQPTPTPAPAPGMVRLYHGGALAAERTTGSVWFSSDLAYAQGYADKAGGTVSYVDVPADDPLIAPDYPEQSIAAGFHQNVNLPPDLARQRQPFVETGRVDEFGQGLFDEEPATEDVLETGEVQPRLPGAEAVRETEIATPEMEAPFSLTSETQQRKPRQDTFFQSAYHGSPHIFDRFSLHAMGTGEGAQAYGWGLYFAGAREVAEFYREKLAGEKMAKGLFLDGTSLWDREIGLFYVKWRKDGNTWLATSEPQDRDVQRGLLELDPRITVYRPEKVPDIIQRTRTEIERSIANMEKEHAAGHTFSGDLERDLYDKENYRNALKALDLYGEALEFKPEQKPGRTYTVEIPEDEDFLSLDLSVSEQSPKVQAALQALGFDVVDAQYPMMPDARRHLEELLAAFDRSGSEPLVTGYGMTLSREQLAEGIHYTATNDRAAFKGWWREHSDKLTKWGDIRTYPQTGENVYEALKTRARHEAPHLDHKESARFASLQLQQQGLAGMRYLDGSSRAAGEGSYNYVVVDDRLVEITEFDQPLQPDEGPSELTAQDVEQWAAGVKEQLPSLHHFHVYLSQTGDLYLSAIAIKREGQKQGTGTQAMQALIKFADLHGKRITLEPASGADTGWGTTSRARLVRFYQRFGFRENRGRSKDFRLSANAMYREPTLRGSDLELKQPLFHGSPHDFDRFSTKHIGTGEGAAAYGHGLYFAENPAVAAGYFDRLSGSPQVKRMKIGSLVVGQMNDFDYSRNAHVSDLENIRASLTEDLLIHSDELLAAGTGGFREHVLQMLDSKIADYETEWPEGAVAAKQLRTALAKPGALTIQWDPKTGGVYQVEIPDAQIALMLDWDAPLSEQSPHIQEVLRPIVQESIDREDTTLKTWQVATGEDAYAALRLHISPTYVDDATWQKAAKAASEWLQERGVPGLRYLDQGSRDQGVGTRNVVVFDDSIITLTHKDGTAVTAKERKEFLQGEGEGAQGPTGRPDRRGSIRFGPGREITISLFEKADPSTLIHEFGHLFLRTMEDLELRPEASERLKGMMGTLRQWYADNGIADDDEVGRQELFARGFEQYSLEGKAPSLALRDVFHSFRAWMLGVYRSIRGLKVNLTPEVRDVFDRMLATDQAIAEAKASGKVAPMFLTAAAAGMSEREFALYSSTIQDANRTETERLERKVLGEVRREQEADWKRQRDDIKLQVQVELGDSPTYRALSAMRTGTNPDGSPMFEGMDPEPLKLSRQIILNTYGAEKLRTLPAGIYSREGGLHPDLVAERVGFTSGDEMLNAIVGARPYAEAVETETTSRMLERHGSMLLDGSLPEQAQAAVANEDRESVLRAELRALAKLRAVASPFRQFGEAQLRDERRERAYERRWFEAETQLRIAIAEGHKQVEIDELAAELRNMRQKARGGAATIAAAVPPAGEIREMATTRIAGMRIRDIAPQRFWSAAMRAGQQATALAARQDFDAAIVAKQQQLLSLALYREAMRVRDDVQARYKAALKLDSKASRQAVGVAGASYQEQIDGLLDRFELAQVSRKALDKRADLRMWVAAMEGEGQPVDIPEDVLNEARRVNWQEVTVEEFVGVTDALQHIAHLARFKNRLLKAKAARELAAVANGVAQKIRDTFTRTPPTLDLDRRPSGERKRSWGDVIAGHRKLASFVREMDGLEDGGPVWTALLQPLNEAADTEAVMMADATRRLQALADAAFPGSQKSTLYDMTEVKGVGSLSKMSRIMVALNWGNEGNRERLRTGNRYDNQQVQAILDSLSGADMTFVQGIFDLFESYRPEMEAKQKRITGVSPEWVEAVPITTTAGTFRGGYFPVKYDERRDLSKLKLADLETANLAKHAAYAGSTTKRNHLQSRTKATGVLRLDFGPIFEHVGQVIHDLSHHEALLDVSRVLGHRDVQNAVKDTYGDIIYNQMRHAIEDVAVGLKGARNGTERAINHVRTGATVVGLAWNFTTALMQPIGFTNSVNRIGAKWVAKGVSRIAAGPDSMQGTVEWIYSVSAMMRMRGETQSREISEIRQAIGLASSKGVGKVIDQAFEMTGDVVTRQGIADSYFWFIQQAQRMVDVPTWLGQYEKSMAAGETEERAVALADQAVKDSQGGGQVVDLSEVQRGTPWQKLWTNFYSYFNVVHNQHMEAHARYRLSEKDVAGVGRLASDYLMLFVVPAVLGYTIRHALKGDLPKKDKLWLDLLGEAASYFAGTMLGMREIAGALQGSYGYEGPAGARAFAVLSRAGVQVRQTVKEIGEGHPEKGLDAALWKTLNEAGGVFLHYPAAQVNKSLQGIVALIEGKTSNPVAVAVGPPPRQKAR